MSRMGEVVELYRLETTRNGEPYSEVVTMTYTAIGVTIRQDVSLGENGKHQAYGIVNLTDSVVERLISSYRQEPGGGRAADGDGAGTEGSVGDGDE